jgi:hypothetical protein
MSDVDDYTSKVDPRLREQFAKLRLIIKKALPGSCESVKWGIPYYSLNGVGVASIAEYSQHVNLYFLQGAKLSSDLLEGTGRGMRHITVKTLKDIKEGEFTRLLSQAGKLVAEGPRDKDRPVGEARRSKSSS